METLIKIPDTSGLVTTAISKTKISEVENKIQGKKSSLVTTIVLNTIIVKLKTKFPIMLNKLLLNNLIS